MLTLHLIFFINFTSLIKIDVEKIQILFRRNETFLMLRGIWSLKKQVKYFVNHTLQWIYNRVCHEFRLIQRDDYFWVNFDCFWIEQVSISSTLNAHVFCTNVHFGSFFLAHVTRKKLPKQTFVQKTRAYKVDDIEPSILEAAGAILKIGLSLKPNHHQEI